jgi:hypothetical protein
MRTRKTLPARPDMNAPPQSPRPAGRWARARRAASELTPDAIEQVAQRVAQLLRHEPHSINDGLSKPPDLIDAGRLARHLGVTRAWVYDNATQLGAIPLSDGPRPRLRFDLTTATQAFQTRRRNQPAATNETPRPRPTGRRRTPPAVPLLPVHEPRTRGILARWHRAQGRNR